MKPRSLNKLERQKSKFREVKSLHGRMLERSGLQREILRHAEVILPSLHMYTCVLHNSQNSQSWDSLHSHQTDWRDLITHGKSG